MRRFAGPAVPEVGRIQSSSELGRDFALGQGAGYDVAHLGGNFSEACSCGNAGLLERFVSANHPLGCITVRQRRGGDKNIWQIGAPVVMRRSPQCPRQRHVRTGFELSGVVDGNTAVGQRPARAIPAGVLNAEVEDGCIGDRSLSLGSIELLRMDAVSERLSTLHPFTIDTGH